MVEMGIQQHQNVVNEKNPNQAMEKLLAPGLKGISSEKSKLVMQQMNKLSQQGLGLDLSSADTKEWMMRAQEYIPGISEKASKLLNSCEQFVNTNQAGAKILAKASACVDEAERRDVSSKITNALSDIDVEVK